MKHSSRVISILLGVLVLCANTAFYMVLPFVRDVQRAGLDSSRYIPGNIALLIAAFVAIDICYFCFIYYFYPEKNRKLWLGVTLFNAIFLAALGILLFREVV